MLEKGQGNRNGDLIEDDDDEAQAGGTSKNREESMTESGQDAFGKAGKQRSSTSGTTPLGGESRTASERPGPGGIEGETDSR